MNMRSKMGLIASAAAVSFGVGATAAQAEPVEVTGGETTLKINKGTATALEDLGISAAGTEYAVKKGEYDYAPIDDGGGGILKHKGTLTLEGEDAKVKLKSFEVDVFGVEGNQPDPKIQGVLIAKVGGKSVEVADLSTKKYESDEEDHTFTGLKAKLSEDGAKALNKAFDVDELEGGLKLGTLSNESEVK